MRSVTVASPRFVPVLFGCWALKEPFCLTEQVKPLCVFAVPYAFIVIGNLHFWNNLRSAPKRTSQKDKQWHIPFQNSIFWKSILWRIEVFGLWPTGINCFVELIACVATYFRRIIIYFHVNLKFFPSCKAIKLERVVKLVRLIRKRRKICWKYNSKIAL